MAYFADITPFGKEAAVRAHGLLTVLVRPGSRVVGMAAHRLTTSADRELWDIWLTGAGSPVPGDWTLDEVTGEFIEIKGGAGR